MSSTLVSMSQDIEQIPHKHKGPRRPRRHENNMKNSPEVSDSSATPHQKKKHHGTPKAVTVSQTVMTSPPPTAEMDLPGIQGLDLGDNSTSTQKKRRSRKNTGRSGPPPNVNVHPRSPPADQYMQGTPIKAMQMYAGPTFSASPAASSLPMPKFFAQSMPVQRPIQPTEQLDVTSDDSSEGAGGDSPTLRPALRAANQPPREASPLDMLFNADRQEKANKARLGSNLGPDRAKSVSPGYDSAISSPQSMFSVPQTPPPINNNNQDRAQSIKHLLMYPQAQRSSGTPNQPTYLPIQRPTFERATSENSTPRTTHPYYQNESPFGRPLFDNAGNLTTPPSSARPYDSRRPLNQQQRQDLLKSLPLDQSPDVIKSPSFAPLA